MDKQNNALIASWSAQISYAELTAYASSLLELDYTDTTVTDEKPTVASDLLDERPLPNHFCVPKLSFTTMVCPAGVVMWSGGCASVVKMTVFETFNFKTVLSSVVIKASSNDAAPSAVSLKIKMSSANRRSSKGGYPSWKSIPHPFPSVHARQFSIDHCNTEQNRRGLSTHLVKL